MNVGKHMKLLLLISCLPCAVLATQTPEIKFSVPASGRDYLWTMIACDEKEERYVDDLYDAFLVATEKKELPKECFRVPLHFATFTGDYYVFERGYYVSQNSLRGFSLAIPKNCVVVKDGMIAPVYPLTVASSDGKQGLQIVMLKRKEPNQPPEPTAPSGRGSPRPAADKHHEQGSKK
jgi:hypothetical protein